MAGFLLAMLSLLIAAPSPSGEVFSCSVSNINGRLSVNARDCPLDSLLLALCGQIQCELYFDPGIEDRMTVSFENQDVDQALFRTLRSFDYVITWGKGGESGEARESRIASIRVFRDGRSDEAVLMQLSAQAIDPAIAECEKSLADKNNPEGAREASEKLVQNGSPAALKALFSAVPRWNENGTLTDPVSRTALTVTNQSAAPVLLREYLAATDESVILASRFDLSQMADSALVKTIGGLYEKSDDPDQREKLELLTSSISSREAESELMGLAGPPGRLPEAPLAWAALKALGNMGTATATDHLLAGLEKGRGNEAGELAEIVQNVSASPSSVAALRYAALGNKRFSSQRTRLAAIKGLCRFKDGETIRVLEKLAHDPSEAIRLAALQKAE